MCTSLRGVAFFGASVHTVVGFILFSRYVIATFVFTFYNFNNFEKVTAFLAPFMVYVTLLLGLGIIIFHSVEKECFVILKWSSVAFSILQLVVFLAILVLKLTPNFQYQQFPFLPDSLVNSLSNVNYNNKTSGNPEVYLAVPHGTTLDEKDLIIKPSSKSPSSDPPDPGGTMGGDDITIPNSSSKEKDGLLLTEIYRLTILICCVAATLVYLLFLFLYMRQLNEEDTGHVFGHGGHAVTRNVAFYVHPQYTSNPNQLTSQGIHDNNKGQPGSVQSRSQTQIPQQFLPQPQSQQAPKKINQVQSAHPQQPQSQQLQPPLSHPPSSVDGSGSNPEVQRSPKRQGRSSQQSSLQSQSQSNPQQQNFSPKRNPQHPPPSSLGGGGTCDTNINPHPPPHPQFQHQPPPPHPSQLPILGPTPGVQGQIVNFPHGGAPQQQQLQQQHHHPPQPIMRGQIPAQVRIGFYPHDLLQDPQSQNLGVSPQNIRPRPGPGPYLGETDNIMMGQHQGGQAVIRGPPHPPGQYQHHHPGHHPQVQRVQFQQHSTFPSDSSSSVAYSPNPPRGKQHPISMV